MEVPAHFQARCERLAPLWQIDHSGGDSEAVLHEICHLVTLKEPFPKSNPSQVPRGDLPKVISGLVAALPVKAQDWDEAKTIAAELRVYEGLDEELDIEACLGATGIPYSRYPVMERRIQALLPCKTTQRNAEAAVRMVINNTPEIPTDAEVRGLALSSNLGIRAEQGYTFWDFTRNEVAWSGDEGESLGLTWYRFHTILLREKVEKIRFPS